MGCIGHALKTLAEVAEKVMYSKQAIEAYRESLKGISPEEQPSDYGISKGNLGILYRMLAKEETKEKYCQLSITTLQEALLLLPEDTNPSHHYWIEHQLKLTQDLCDNHRSS